MDRNSKSMDSIKKTIATAASLAAFVVLVRSLINEFIPCEVRSYFSFAAGAVRAHFYSHHTIVVKETEGYSANQIYDAANTYLATKVISTAIPRLRVSKRDDERRNITVSLEEGVEMIDVYEGIAFKWQLQLSCRGSNSSNQRSDHSMPTVVRSLELSFHKKHKEFVLNSYLPYILDRSKAIKAEDRTLKLYMNEGDSWTPINFHHPATFDTLAMDSELKNTVMADLTRFIKRKEYYRRIGKAWKRGYLLYGPPGTGKSSLVAAMANYVKFDIYDLELTDVRWNSGLRRLLVGMGNKSILVVEDIDSSLELEHRISEAESASQEGQSGGRDEKVTLSGLLNFVDGLWSTSGEERIIVFTANNKERLDPALLRPGRMDMHVHMGYCRASGFRMLALNYHNVDDHLLFGEIEGLIEEVEVTPAEVAEELMRSDDTDIALRGSVRFLQGKIKERGESEPNIHPSSST